jgi:hypothetical protein
MHQLCIRLQGMYMCMYICSNTHTHTYVCIFNLVYTSIKTPMCLHTHTHAHLYNKNRLGMHTQTCILEIYPCHLAQILFLNACMRMCMYKCLYAHVHVYMYVCTQSMYIKLKYILDAIQLSCKTLRDYMLTHTRIYRDTHRTNTHIHMHITYTSPGAYNWHARHSICMYTYTQTHTQK